jgi:hypothetical protein
LLIKPVPKITPSQVVEKKIENLPAILEEEAAKHDAHKPHPKQYLTP